jgi:hypothetical protein
MNMYAGYNLILKFILRRPLLSQKIERERILNNKAKFFTFMSLDFSFVWVE